MQIVLDRVVNEAKGEDESVQDREDEDEAAKQSVSKLGAGDAGKAYNRRYPSLIIHLSNFSLVVNSFCTSCVISPDNSILVSGVHLDLSDCLSDPVLLLLLLYPP